MVEGTPDGGQELVNGRYRLIETIGQGGMGTVWRGHDELLDREIAIKQVLFPSDLDDGERAELSALALREARATARLNHPGIVTIFDVIDADGAPTIVMELLEGRSLADILREEVRLPYQRVAEIGAAVLEALREAHAAGIVHRDLKPANILISDRRIVLTDFGVAQRVGERAEDFDDVLGTPAFMAPEQAENAAASPAADLWSLGAVLFNAVEGRPPFQGPDHATVLLTLLTQEAPALVNGGPLKPLIAALLIKDPDRRPTAEDTAERLAAILREDDDGASPASEKRAILPPGPGKVKSGGATASSTPAPAPAPLPKPAAPPGALPNRPHYVRPDGPRPHSVPALAPSQGAGRVLAGMVVAVLGFALLYSCAYFSSSGSPSGIGPSASDSFGGLPSAPASPPATSPEPTPTTPDTPTGFHAVAISPDGDTIAFGGSSGVVRLYGTTSHKLLRSLRPPEDSGEEISALAFSPDGRRIAIGRQYADEVQVWDFAKGEKYALSGFSDVLKVLRFSSDGRTLIAGGSKGTIGRWTMRTSAYRGGSISVPDGNDGCLGMAISPNGYVACGYGGDRSNGVLVWDTEKGRQVASWPGAEANAIALSPDGRTLAFDDRRFDDSLQVWDIASHREKHVLPVRVIASGDPLTFGPDGDTLAVPTVDVYRTPSVPVIQIWDVSAEKKVATFDGTQDLYDLAFSPDGAMLAGADNTDDGVLWKIRSGKKLASWRE
ncbi:hypothetical protein GCM10023196_068840 [Actinoallomurus vinaceus]|uniref:non-specific serine/threonine protein kinase n=1 Tax=Actinoallomurus vinaceus TaxID=1080074 RepID=A0ABP8UN67_9ACTN